MAETQSSISDWAMNTFGVPGSDASVAARANREMAELVQAVVSGHPAHKIREEIADVMIVLYRLMERCGGDMQREVDKKMAINRTREWILDGDGHGQHVKEKA